MFKIEVWNHTTAFFLVSSIEHDHFLTAIDNAILMTMLGKGLATEYFVLLKEDNHVILELREDKIVIGEKYSSFPQSLDMALKVLGTLDVEIYAQESCEPIESVHTIYVSVCNTDVCIQNSLSILRVRASLGLYTRFCGCELALLKLSRPIKQYGEYITTPIHTNDSFINLINYLSKI